MLIGLQVNWATISYMGHGHCDGPGFFLYGAIKITFRTRYYHYVFFAIYNHDFRFKLPKSYFELPYIIIILNKNYQNHILNSHI